MGQEQGKNSELTTLPGRYTLFAQQHIDQQQVERRCASEFGPGDF
jgi:hypothetical protein